MTKDKIFKYKEQGYELSPLRVAYEYTECLIDSENQAHSPSATGMYDVWLEECAMSDYGQYMVWDSEEYILKFLSEIERMA